MFGRKDSFLSGEQKARIVKAIREAERNTSGEIRVHIEASSGELDVLFRAQDVFNELKMYRTEQRNGVILYIAYNDHRFVIYGDSGIHEKVGDNYWKETSDLLHDYFVKSEFEAGITAAIHSIGEKLKVFFPYHANDKNELPDEISEG